MILIPKVVQKPLSAQNLSHRQSCWSFAPRASSCVRDRHRSEPSGYPLLLHQFLPRPLSRHAHGHDGGHRLKQSDVLSLQDSPRGYSKSQQPMPAEPAQ